MSSSFEAPPLAAACVPPRLSECMETLVVEQAFSARATFNRVTIGLEVRGVKSLIIKAGPMGQGLQT